MNSSIRRTVLEVYVKHMLSDIPSYLQILTFTSFLSLFVRNVVVIGFITTLLLEFYFLSKMDERGQLIIHQVALRNLEGKEKVSTKHLAEMVTRKVFIYNQVISIGFGSIGTVIAIAITHSFNK